MSGPIAISGPRAVVLRFDTPIAGMPIGGLPVHVLQPELEGFFDDVGHFVSHAVSDVGHAVSDVGHAIDHAAHDVGKAVGDAAKFVVHAVEHPDQAISEAANWIGHAVTDVVKFVGHNIVVFVQLVQVGVSFIPGIGEGLSAVIGAGLALAEGKSITDALIAAALSALPGGPLVAMAASIATEAISGVIEHKSFADIAGNIIADNIPAGGALAKAVVHGVASVVGAATTGHNVGQALISGVTSVVGSAVGGQIPIPDAISNAVGGAAGKVVSGVANTLGQSVVNAAGQVVSGVASGKRIDQALAGAAAGVVVGAVRDQLPGGARGVFDTATGAASQVIQGKPLDMVLLGTARANLPGGEDARRAFDTAVALTHAKNVQQAGIKNPISLLPANDAKAAKFFHATRVIVAVGLKAPPGISFDALHKLQLKALQDHIHAGAPAVARPVHPAAARRPAGAPPMRRTPSPVQSQARTSPERSGAAQGASWRPSYAMAVFHPASAPPLDGLFDDMTHAVVSKAADLVQGASSAASSLPGPAGAVARAIATPAAAAARAASSVPTSPSSPSTGPKPRPSATARTQPRATTQPDAHSSLVLPLALGGAAIAAAGGAVWWAHMNHEHGKGAARK